METEEKHRLAQANEDRSMSLPPIITYYVLIIYELNVLRTQKCIQQKRTYCQLHIKLKLSAAESLEMKKTETVLNLIQSICFWKSIESPMCCVSS